jgi:hypothetical protein
MVVLVAGLAAAAVLLVGPGESGAIPAFARKYRTSCSTCHVSYPKLNAFGEAYRLSAYQIPDGDEAFIKEEPVSLGSEAWKRVWPEGIWPSSIPGTAPIAVRATGAFLADLRGLGNTDSGSEDGKYSFLFPTAFNIHAAGNLAEDVSLWFAAHLFQGDSWGGLGKLHVTFANLGDAWLPRQLVNLRVGQFVPAALAFDHHRNLTFSTPIVATANVVDGAPFSIGHVHGSGASGGGDGHAGHSGSGTTFSGAFALGDPQVGAELYGLFAPRLEYTLGVVNGSGTVLDENNAKDLYGRLRFKLGGIAFDGTSPDAGKGDDEGEPKLRDQGAWVDNSVTIGAVGYWGTHVMGTSAVKEHPMVDSLGNLVVGDDGKAVMTSETITTSHESDVIRAGGDIVLNFFDLELMTMAVWGRDTNPFGIEEEVDSLVAMSQLDWVTPWPFLVTSLRYETARFFGHGDPVPEDAQHLVVGLTTLVRANIRVQLEGQVDLNRSESELEEDYAAIILDASF